MEKEVVISNGNGLVVMVVRIRNSWTGEIFIALVQGRHGDFTFPKGRVEDGETPEQTLERELHTELELELSDASSWCWLGEIEASCQRQRFPVFWALVEIPDLVPLCTETDEPDFRELVHLVPQSQLAVLMAQGKFFQTYSDQLRKVKPELYHRLFFPTECVE